VRQLDIKVLNVIDARCNREMYFTVPIFSKLTVPESHSGYLFTQNGQ